MLTAELAARTQSQWRGLNIYPSRVSEEAEMVDRKFPIRRNLRWTLCLMAVCCPSLSCHLQKTLSQLELAVEHHWILLFERLCVRRVDDGSQRKSISFSMNAHTLGNVLLSVRFAAVGSHLPATSAAICRCTVTRNRLCVNCAAEHSSAACISRTISLFMWLHIHIRAAFVRNGLTPVGSCGCIFAMCMIGRQLPQPTASGTHVRCATKTSRQKATWELTYGRTREKSHLSVHVGRLMHSASSWCSTHDYTRTNDHLAVRHAAVLFDFAVHTSSIIVHTRERSHMSVNSAESRTQTKLDFGRMQHACMLLRMRMYLPPASLR